MPTATETPVQGLAHCQDARCMGYEQEPVQAIQTITEVTYLDNGGDMPGIEQSFHDLRFVDENDVECVHCGKPRVVTSQQRPEYPNVSGHDPMGLFEFRGKTEGQIKELHYKQELAEKDRELEVQGLRAELAELRALLTQQAQQTAQAPAAVSETVPESAPKRAPGRPRKDTSE